jgi:hypothetical protein
MPDWELINKITFWERVKFRKQEWINKKGIDNEKRSIRHKNELKKKWM